MGRPDPRLPPDLDLRRFLALLPPDLRDLALRQLAATDLLSLDRDWPSWAHPGQSAPPGEWRTWC